MKVRPGKLSVLLLAAILAASAVAGCGAGKASGGTENTAGKTEPAGSTSQSETTAASTAAESEKPDISKEVTLKMYLLGDGAPDVPAVYEEVNKKLKSDINATVNVNFFGWSDWQKKYQLLLASGEEYDLIISAWWSSYADNARKGAFWELTQERLGKYAPETVKNSSEAVLKSGRVDGKLYILPMNYNEFSAYGYVVRGDIMKKYNVPDIKSIDDFGVYLDAIAKNEKGMIPYDTGNSYDNWGLSWLALRAANEWYSPDNLMLCMKMRDDSHKVFVEGGTAEALEFYKKMKEWKNKGYWSRNALVNKVTSKDSLLNGKSGACITNLLEANSIYQQAKESHPEWDIRFYPGNTDRATYANSYISNGMSVNAKSANPERALMLLDLFKNNEEYFDLTTYGIKGRHYDVTADGQLTALKDSANFGADVACPWGWRDDRFYKTFANGLPNFADILKSNKERMVIIPAVNFTADQTAVKDKVALFNNIGQQYELPLRLGFSEDTGNDHAVFMDKLKAAGLDDYVADYQKQLDTFYAEYNN